jgi:hypothetical protein
MPKFENWREVEEGEHWEHEDYPEEVYLGEVDDEDLGGTQYYAWNKDQNSEFRFLIESSSKVTDVREAAREWMDDNPHGLASHSTELATDVGNWNWVDREYEGFNTEGVWVNPATEQTVSVTKDPGMYGGADWEVHGDKLWVFTEREEAVKKAKAWMKRYPAGWEGGNNMGDFLNVTTGNDDVESDLDRGEK